MPPDAVGRLLVASLHQSIADLLPLRLPFYEHWLNEGGFRDGGIGLPPFSAVLSFLRQEGPAYDAVTAKAGEYAADWMLESTSTIGRSSVRALPPWLQARLAVRLVKALVTRSYGRSRAFWSIRGGVAHIRVGQSVFCSVRAPTATPLCTFYAAASTRVLGAYGFRSSAAIVSCRGRGESTCELTIPVARPRVREVSAP